MKVAVSAKGSDPNSQIDPRFGRCAYFVIVDTNDLSFQAFNNDNMALGGGAGIQSAQLVASKGAKAVITGHCGPNAADTLSAAGIRVYVGQSGTVMGAVKRYKAGALIPSAEPNVSDHSGIAEPAQGDRGMSSGAGTGRTTGMGGGMGRGAGMGRGVGCGRGRGMGRAFSTGGPVVSQPVNFQGADAGEEVNSLRQQVSNLNLQIRELQDRIRGLNEEKG